MHRYIFIMACTVVFITSCNVNGEELGRLSINEISYNEEQMVMRQVTINLMKGDKIKFWTEMDLSFRGDVAMRFRIEIIKDGMTYGGLEINPMERDITLEENKIEVDGLVDWRFSAKHASLSIDENGKYTFRGILVASENPTLEINKAEVVIRK